MVEAIDAIVEPAAHEEPLAVGRPDQAGKGFRQRDPADDPAGLGVYRYDLMLAVPGVQDRQHWLAGMHGNLHGEVSQAQSACLPA